jgi:hypothetical protein
MNEEKYWNLMSRYLADDLSLEETETLLRWLDEESSRAGLLKELQEAWDISRNYPEKFSVDSNAALLKVKRTILAAHPTGEKEARRAVLFQWIYLAVGILVLVGVLLLTWYQVSGNG